MPLIRILAALTAALLLASPAQAFRFLPWGSPTPIVPPITLQALGLSPAAATAGQAFSATVTGQSGGSTITATSSDGTALAVSYGVLTGTFPAQAADYQVTITFNETLPPATNSPRTSTYQLTVAGSGAAPPGLAVDLGNPLNFIILF